MLNFELHGVNGDVLHLHGDHAAAEGVGLLVDPEGLWEAPMSSVWMQGAFQEGASYLGFRTEPLDVILPLGVRGDGAIQWGMNDNRLRNALGDPDSEFELVSYSPSGGRRVKLRLTDAPELAASVDPHFSGVSQYVVQARAGWPRWVGGTATSSFTASSATDSGFVTVSNPTDTPLYLQWVCEAPGRWEIPDFSWRDDEWSDRIIVTPTLGTGEDLSIDTYPAREPYTAANGSNIAGRFAGVMFLHSVPPHTPETQIPVAVTNGRSGVSCMVRMVRNWRRPFGGDL